MSLYRHERGKKNRDVCTLCNRARDDLVRVNERRAVCLDCKELYMPLISRGLK